MRTSTSKRTRVRDVPSSERPRSDDTGLLDLIMRPTAETDGLGQATIGTLAGIAASGVPLVTYPSSPSTTALPARSTCAVGPSAVGGAVVLLFEDRDPRRPVVIGVIRDPRATGTAAPAGDPRREVVVDGERLVLTARNEIELRCGESSITLTREGKIVVRGKNLLSRASSVNRIKGGAVQIN